MEKNEKKFKEMKSIFNRSKRKGFMSLAIVSAMTVILANSPVVANAASKDTVEKVVTQKLNLGDSELIDTKGVTYEVDKKSEFEAIVMYRNEQGLKFALSKGKEVNSIQSMNIVVVKVSENDFKSLQKNGDILFVERNLIMEVEQESFNMTDFGEELLTQVKSNEYAGWGYGYMNIQEAYKKGITGKGIKIAVADSGVSNHPDLDIAEHVYPNGNKVNLYDSDGHGSHIAGIISAKDNNDGAIGIAPSADIYSIKMEDDAGRISSYQFLLALEWAIDNDMDLLNASITFNLNSPIFQAAINKAYDQGLIVVAATGNDGAENIRYPASYANVIAVGAVTPDDERDSFSNYGDTLDFVAPGKRIAGVSYTGGYITKTGTSMAAPHVVGLLALLMEEFPNKNADWYFKALKDMSVDGDIKGYDKNTGFGAPKYQPSLINKEGGEKEEDSAVVVDDLPMNQQRYYKLIESYLNNIEFATGSYKEHFLNEAEKYMGYIESSPVRDKLLEILHEHGRLQEEKYSTGVKYEEKTVSSVSDLSSKEQRYYNSALGYLDEIAKAKTEREFNRLLGKVENLLSKIQSSPIRDVLLARAHYYGGALNIPYNDGSYYKGQIVGFVPSVPPTNPDVGNPKPEKPMPPADMTGRETEVSQLPKTQQDYYYLAQNHINQATTGAGESHLNKAVNYVLMINNSPIRDVLLRQLHQYGRLLDVPYSTGLYYYGDVNNTPWQPTNPVPNPNPDGGKTEPEKPTTPPTTPPTNPGGGVTSEDRPSIDVPTAKQIYIENLFDSIVKYPEITSYRTRAEEVINELPDSIEKDEYLRRLNEL